MTYLHYIGPALLTWFKGIRWLWTRREPWPLQVGPGWGIVYKPGWGPWRFLPVYLTTYLAGTIAGYGVVSMSRAWYDRSENRAFAGTMTRLLDWALPGARHGAEAGPPLWGVKGVRK